MGIGRLLNPFLEAAKRKGLDVSNAGNLGRALDQGYAKDFPELFEELQDAYRAGGASPGLNTQSQNWSGNYRYSESDAAPSRFFHGTRDDIGSFQLAHPNRKDAGWLGEAISITDNPQYAYRHALQKSGDGIPRVMPLYARLQNPLLANDKFMAQMKGASPEMSKAVSKAITDVGHGAMVTSRAPDAREIAVYDPSNIRSQFAVFDPDNTGKPWLLGGLSGAAPYLASGALAAGALAPQDAEASFIGKLSKVWPHDMEGMAIKMKDAGLSRKEIWQKTGVDLDAVDGKPRTEIDDSGLSLDANKLSWGSREDIKRGSAGVEMLGNYTAHPELDYAVNGLLTPDWADKHLMSRIIPDTSNASYGSGLVTHGIDKNTMSFTPENRSAVAHELQHAIQQKEGFARGGDPDTFMSGLQHKKSAFESEISNLNSQMHDIVRQKDMAKELGDADRVKFLEGRYLETMASREEYVQKLRSEGLLDSIDMMDTANKQYRSLAGEAESRNVQTRLDMTPQERRATPPWETLDVPESDQLVRMRGSATPGLLAATAGATGTGMAVSPYMFNQAQPSAFWDGVLSKGLAALDMPSQGVYGLARGAYGALTGEADPMAQAAKVAGQPIDTTAWQFGDYLLDKTRSPAAAALGYGLANLWSPSPI